MDRERRRTMEGLTEAMPMSKSFADECARSALETSVLSRSDSEDDSEYDEEGLIDLVKSTL